MPDPICEYVTVGRPSTSEAVNAAFAEVIRQHPELEGQEWYACEIGPEDLPPGEEGDLVLFIHASSGANADEAYCRTPDAELCASKSVSPEEDDLAMKTLDFVFDGGKRRPINTTNNDTLRTKIAALSADEKDARVKEFVEFFTNLCGLVPAEYDAATIEQLFDERDAFPEGSPERHAVVLKIFNSTFLGQPTRVRK
jgi:hypothetical protein